MGHARNILKTQDLQPRAYPVRHKGIFISTAGTGWENVFSSAFPIMTAFFDIMGFGYDDNIIANDMDRYKGIRNHPTALAEAREKGGKVVGVLSELKGKEEKIRRAGAGRYKRGRGHRKRPR